MLRSRTTISCRLIAPTVALWATFGCATARADQDPEASFRTFPSSIQWTSELPAGTSVPPVAVRHLVVVSLITGSILAKDVGTGKDVWTAKLAATAPVAASDEIVIVAAEDGVYALAVADGSTKWKKDITGITVAPVLAGGWAIVASGDALTALRAADGAQIWSRTIAPISRPATIDGDVLYQPFDDGRVVALELTSGAPQWEAKFGTIHTSPVVYGDRLYVGADKHLVCLKIADGEEDWRFKIGAALVGSIAADNQQIYTASMDNLLTAFRRSDGSREWHKDLGYRPTGGPILTGPSVTAPGRTATIRAFNVSRGTAAAQLVLPSQAVASPATFPRDESSPGRLAIVANEVGKPWLLVVAVEAPPAPPALPLAPISSLPGTSLPIPKNP